MFRMGQQLLALALVLAPAAFPLPAAATLLHTWVSAGGSNGGSCGDFSTPCKDLPTAYQNTAAGGEITCVSSGDFAASGQPLTIVNSITIDCEGALGGATTVAGGASLQFISIQTSAGAVVVLRGLDLDAMGQGSCGAGGGIIAFMGAGTLHVQKTKINHIAAGCNGIWVNATGPTEIDISDCDITDNGTSGTGGGIFILPTSGVTASVSIDRSHINNNFFGILVDGKSGGTVKGTISDSVVSGNTEDAIAATSSGTSVWLLVDQTKVSGNAFGVAAGGSGAEILVRNTSVFNNTTGLSTSGGGAVYSYGTNSVNGNTTNGAFTGTVGMQ